MLRAALFDLDGTLTDPGTGINACIRHALDAIGMPVPSTAELRAWIGPPLLDSFRDHLGSRSLADDALRRYRDRYSRIGMFENEPYPGIDEALATIASRIDVMLVVTSKPRVFASTIVEHFGLDRYFAGVYGSELDGSLTDKRELIGQALRSESLAAEAAVMIGDRRHDVVGAQANSVASIGVLWGYGSRRELEAAGAGRMCSSVAALPRCLFAD